MSLSSSWFRDARYGLFIHYGLFSLLGRSEWVMNREQIPVTEYARLADRFTAEKFDADALIRRARDWGMRYAVMVTKHQEGFCLYDSSVTDFNTVKTAARRDLVAEFVAACRKHGLKIGLYHSLNDWSLVPNSTDAIERPAECHDKFINLVHAQIRDVIQEVNKVSRTIASAVEEQSITTKEIAQNVAQVASASETVSTGVSESASAGQEITRNIADVSTIANSTAQGAAETKASSDKLVQLEGQLSALVSQFKV